MTWPAPVLWMLLFVGFFVRGPLLFLLFGICGAIGTLQMLPGDALGGINVLPQVVCACLIIARVALQPGNVERAIESALTIRQAGLFTLFTLLSILTAFVLPRLYGGQIVVVPVALATSGTTLLYPSGANLTQPTYAVISYLVVLAFSILGGTRRFQKVYMDAILWQGIALVVTGVVDLLTYNLGAGYLLEAFRNASYALLTDTEAVGAKRIVGLMPEASVYGTACVVGAARLLFLRPCFDDGKRRWIVPALIFALLALAALSTSSSAYIGLGVLALAYAANWLFRLRSPAVLHPAGLHSEAITLIVVVFALATLSFLHPGIFASLWDVIDVMVFQKTSSASYVERSLWTQVGWTAFLDSGGLGVGFGSARVSNWYVAILAGTGVLGAVLLFGFILKLLCAPVQGAGTYDRELLRGLRFSLVPWLVVAWFSGAVPDMGADIAATLGVLIGVSYRPDHRRQSAADQPLGRGTRGMMMRPVRPVAPRLR